MTFGRLLYWLRALLRPAPVLDLMMIATLWLPAVTPHSARHCFISTLQAQGIEVGLVAKLAGHANANVTLVSPTGTLKYVSEIVQWSCSVLLIARASMPGGAGGNVNQIWKATIHIRTRRGGSRLAIGRTCGAKGVTGGWVSAFYFA
jgi:hypothetical protein